MSQRLVRGLLLVPFVVLLACGRKTQQQPTALPESPPPPPAAQSGAAPPGASNEELRTVPPPPPVQPEAEGWIEEAPPPAPPPEARTTFGYRVQVFASSTRQGAEEAAARARQLLQEKVVVEYEAPLYKVRAGNCVTRHEAERLKARAIELGFEGPWITETTVEVP